MNMARSFLKRETDKSSPQRGFECPEKNQLTTPVSPSCVTDVAEESLSAEDRSCSTKSYSTSLGRDFQLDAKQNDARSETDSQSQEMTLGVSFYDIDFDDESYPEVKYLPSKYVKDYQTENLANETESIAHVHGERREYTELKQKIYESMIYMNDEISPKFVDVESPCSTVSVQRKHSDSMSSSFQSEFGLAEEHNCFVSRIQALEALVEEQRKEQLAYVEANQELERKSIKVGEALHEVEQLQSQLCEAHEAIEKMRKERSFHKKTIAKLSRMLQSYGPSVPQSDSNAKVGEGVPQVVTADQCGSITPDGAANMTISNLMKIIEVLEDERHGFMAEIHSLGAAVYELKEERQARELKLSVLENLFDVMDKQFKVMETASKDGPLTCL